MDCDRKLLGGERQTERETDRERERERDRETERRSVFRVIASYMCINDAVISFLF